MERRQFLKALGLLSVGAVLPSLGWMPPQQTTPWSDETPNRCIIFNLQGGADGLNMLVPHGDPDYYRLRPTIHIPASDVWDLDGLFGLHPVMAVLKPYWENQTLGFVQSVGQALQTRSHQRAQNHLFAQLQTLFQEPLRLLHAETPEAFFQFGGNVRILQQLNDPKAALNPVLVSLGGWDTHVDQGGAEGLFARRLKALSEGIADLAKALAGDPNLWKKTTLLVLSEFGRTAAENGFGGTDHGHGQLVWRLGGSVQGGQIQGRQHWRGLREQALYEGRDLPMTSSIDQLLTQWV